MEGDLVELLVFGACSIIVLGGALGVIWSRNPVHSALSLVATLFGIAVLFLNQDAQFLAAVQVIVYTGAIVVLILFVIMLLGVDVAEDVDVEPLAGQFATAITVAVGLVAVLLGSIMLAGQELLTGRPGATAPIVEGEANIEAIGRLIFTDYVFAFEVTAALLTIAVIGAVVLSRRAPGYDPLPEPESMEPPVAADAEQEESHR